MTWWRRAVKRSPMLKPSQAESLIRNGAPIFFIIIFLGRPCRCTSMSLFPRPFYAQG